jgi:hypothetical protein
MSETKSRKSKKAIETEARLLLENLIQDEGDDVLDMAISIAYKENKNVKFVLREKEIAPEIAFSIRYNSGLNIRPSSDL